MVASWNRSPAWNSSPWRRRPSYTWISVNRSVFRRQTAPFRKKCHSTWYYRVQIQNIHWTFDVKRFSHAHARINQQNSQVNWNPSAMLVISMFGRFTFTLVWNYKINACDSLWMCHIQHVWKIMQAYVCVFFLRYLQSTLYNWVTYSDWSSTCWSNPNIRLFHILKWKVMLCSAVGYFKSCQLTEKLPK